MLSPPRSRYGTSPVVSAHDFAQLQRTLGTAGPNLQKIRYTQKYHSPDTHQAITMTPKPIATIAITAPPLDLARMFGYDARPASSGSRGMTHQAPPPSPTGSETRSRGGTPRGNSLPNIQPSSPSWRASTLVGRVGRPCTCWCSIASATRSVCCRTAPRPITCAHATNTSRERVHAAHHRTSTTCGRAPTTSKCLRRGSIKGARRHHDAP